ncbi:hypothetical protein Vadar_008955 [Vaccinium darrowii]|uniref:Uncharacterized protein n=1 Tax=Vaccinium darrowii TaxID=229202 RepID=A0ACB7ZAH7_9ERIC|nr:hypothetical protein Vadar_008955 [Vaccinium darrowii]
MPLIFCAPRAPSANGMYIGDGCGENGDNSVYRCSTCDYDLHVKCAFLKKTVDRVDPEHPLTLYYSNPYQDTGVTFECDVCHHNIPSNSWIFCCLDCDNGTHVNCVSGKERPKAAVQFEKLAAAQQELMNLQIKMQTKTMTTNAIFQGKMMTVNAILHSSTGCYRFCGDATRDAI